ncbi:MAG: MraY family glycosyltransferase [Candidatus Firestonebacteria bacterium]
MLKYIFLFFISFIISAFFIPKIIRFAIKHDAVDKPAHRKIHKKITPLFGGIAIYLALFLTIGIYFLFSNYFRASLFMDNFFLGKKLLGLFLGSTFLLSTGIIDDKWGLPPKLKLFGQIMAVVIILLFGVRMIGVTIPFFNKYIVFPYLISVSITLIWVIAIINSVNFVDGLDGLAAGIVFISSMAFFIIAFFKPPQSSFLFASKVSYFICILSVIVAGGILAFLKFNFNPAKIFMGDCGSQFLGLMLASISIIGSFKGITAFTLFTPVLILTVPIFDIIFAVYRRLKKHVPISKADKSHLHHRLLALGLTPRQAVIILYIVSILFSSVAIILS